MNPQKYEPVPGRSVQIDEVDWVDFPGPLSQGGIRWKTVERGARTGFLGSHIRLPEKAHLSPATCISVPANIS